MQHLPTSPTHALPSPAAVASPGTPVAARLSRKQKAAIIVRLLLNEGADVPLKSLPEDMQAELTRVLGDMRVVDRVTLAEVAQEFAVELDSIGMRMPGDIATALSALDGRINPRLAARLRKEAGVRQIGEPWERLCALEVEELSPIAESESIEVAAVLLSKLTTAKAAELLGALPGETARRITYAISMTSAVTPDAVDRIGLSLASQLDNKPERAFEDEPDERVGEILNFSPSVTRDDVLEGLDAEDQSFADKVRKAIFTFAHVPERINAVDIPKVVRGVDQGDLLTALVAATQSGLEDAAEFILANMSKRLAEGLREEMGEAGKVSTKEGEAAMALVIGAVRELVNSGEIVLIVSEDGDEDA